MQAGQAGNGHRFRGGREPVGNRDPRARATHRRRVQSRATFARFPDGQSRRSRAAARTRAQIRIAGIRSCEIFGTAVAEAMVDWMQRVDAGRSELRELNDLSFARFDARLAERIAEVNAKMDVGFAKVDARFEHLEAKIDAKVANLESRMDATLARHRADLLKWSFADRKS